MSDEKKTKEPHDRLTRMCDRVSDQFENDPEWQEGDNLIIFIDSTVERRGGFVISGWESESEAIMHIFMHLRALFRANGGDLQMLPMFMPSKNPEEN